MASMKQRIWIVKPAEWANRGCGIRPMVISADDDLRDVDSQGSKGPAQKKTTR